MKASTQTRAQALDDLLIRYSIPRRSRVDIEAFVFSWVQEQDRDTRHACAEAVMGLPNGMTHTDAQRACINAQVI